MRPQHGGNLTWAASLAGCSPSMILDFSASINPLGPPHSAIAAIHNHLGDLRNYPDPNYHELRQALSQFHRLPPDWILPGNGSAELLTWASRELAELDVTYLLTPAFGDYLRSLKAFDTSVIRCPLNLAFPSITASATFARAVGPSVQPQVQPQILPPILLDLPAQPAQLGLLLNNPHNPTGWLFSSKEILPYLEQFTLVVIDEAFMDFLPPDQQQSLTESVLDYPNLVILRSLTKFYSLPGLRIGYAIAHPDRLQRWQQWRDPWSVNTLAAAAAVAVLQDTTFQQQTWNWLIEARSQLFQGLSDLPGLSPLASAANYLLVQSEHSVVQLQQQLLKQNRILIRDCMSFPELGDRYFRVAVRTLPENQRLLEGLRAEAGRYKT
ncbi:MAG: threonine-phosphate decarboxylase [Leptolyngbyaceae cyanobacterium SL_5_9]|nr:threonine-phosphate decarboxylase [Leptolyngbyaceae cyanobacterium SL_5_9]NJO75705.1 threonine-phosphate decarboxylase [Leptolyngbyaceae cyanobacterium RM1_406_9]